jgi:hypothetical protein
VGVTFTVHLHLVLRIRMSGALCLLPPRHRDSVPSVSSSCHSSYIDCSINIVNIFFYADVTILITA